MDQTNKLENELYQLMAAFQILLADIWRGFVLNWWFPVCPKKRNANKLSRNNESLEKRARFPQGDLWLTVKISGDPKSKIQIDLWQAVSNELFHILELLLTTGMHQALEVKAES